MRHEDEEGRYGQTRGGRLPGLYSAITTCTMAGINMSQSIVPIKCNASDNSNSSNIINMEGAASVNTRRGRILCMYDLVTKYSRQQAKREGGGCTL